MNIDHLQDRIAPLRAQLIEHPVYQQIATEEQLKAFTEEHVFAVWDFMSLLKSLQQHLTCVKVPWMPTKNKETRRFINEIVVGEESDFDASGKTMSHFEMYLQAMQSMGANTQEMVRFIELISNQVPIEEALDACAINPQTKAFVRFTFSIIQRGNPHEIAAVFTFGREDLIPDMFIEIVKGLQEKEGVSTSRLLYYLERHIEIDGGEHGPLSLQMIDELCENDPVKWNDALQVSLKALQMRIELWNGILKQIDKN
jgi:pyrroloquinoline quinone (PQQ) biosynthesis protein C